MNTSFGRFALGPLFARPFPLSGAVVVFRHQRRGGRASRSMFGAGLLFIASLVASAVLERNAQSYRAVSAGSFFSSTLSLAPWGFDSSAHWQNLATGCLLLFCLGCAAILGASAAPALAEYADIQALLVTQINVWALCAGRLAAAFWTPFVALIASSIFWIGLDIALGQGTTRLMPYLSADVAALSSVFMIGSLGFLLAIHRKTGRSLICGVGGSLSLAGLCVIGVLLINPFIVRMDQPQPCIEAALLVNPVSATATALGNDLLRERWIYDHSNAHDYPFVYPEPFLSAGVFFLAGLGSFGLAALRLQKAHR